MPSLQVSRFRYMCTKIFEIVNQLTPKYIQHFFALQDSDHTTRSVRANMIVQKHYKTVNYGQKTFVSFSTHLWNKLPREIRQTNDINVFKQLMKTWYGPECHCAFCKILEV